MTSPLPKAALEAHDGSSATGTNVDSNPETLGELMSENDDFLEGDMLLSFDRNAVERKWPSVNIPYLISPALKSRTGDILWAMAMVSGDTCVTFHVRNDEADYLYFTSGKGCASYVGFMGGEQPVFVASSCLAGNIAHEILHALGFFHEHTRMDRDKYITILQQNILKGKEENFQIRNGQTFNLEYDVSSILHYGRNFFSGNGLPTIIPKFMTGNIGQRKALTKLDTAKVNSLYKCGT
ncbi:zinc metalloproteinase nas-4 [Thalassophryne amazonica]|uniref:zinc metalloproteinase nas-4 n=1 Tax=Thalassophryne amazonica TaxID=390379 RepID=UPI00147116A0|nr:zinc metalloproteinase nas-4 [Thalassophryne amazonica]